MEDVSLMFRMFIYFKLSEHLATEVPIDDYKAFFYCLHKDSGKLNVEKFSGTSSQFPVNVRSIIPGPGGLSMVLITTPGGGTDSTISCKPSLHLGNRSSGSCNSYNCNF